MRVTIASYGNPGNEMPYNSEYRRRGADPSEASLMSLVILVVSKLSYFKLN
jgi:hypothetical protein